MAAAHSIRLICRMAEVLEKAQFSVDELIAMRQQGQAIIDRARIERIKENREAERQKSKRLRDFYAEAWPILEPTTRYLPNWHIDAIAEHLEAITHGQIKRLLINVPPGSMKSLASSVLWPAWEWGPMGMASLRYLTTSFNDKPVKRDTRKMRNVVTSEWFQTLWPMGMPRLGETSFENEHTGTREGVAFGSLTSQRGDRLIIDDPHSTETAESDTERENTTRKFREGALNRLNDEQNSAILVIMQRLHQDDISGVIEQYGMGFEKLIIPMEFEPERRIHTCIGWTDPRKHDGDLMFPDRWPRANIEAKKTDQGEYVWAGQYQQRPAPREGGMFKVDKIEMVDYAPAGGREVRGWDLAGTAKKKSPFTAGVKMKMVDGVIYITNAKRVRKEVQEMEPWVETVCRNDGFSIFQDLPQDPGVGGKALKASLAKRLHGLNFSITTEPGDKVTRSIPFANQVDAGNVRMVRGDWNKPLMDEMRNFPAATIKDQVDACSRAYARLLQWRENPPMSAPESGDNSNDSSDLPDEEDWGYDDEGDDYPY